MLVKVQEAEHGLITDIGEVPDKADAPLLVPATERHIATFGHAPHLVATDRGFSTLPRAKRASQSWACARSPLRSRATNPRSASPTKEGAPSAAAVPGARAARLASPISKHDFGMDRSRYKGPHRHPPLDSLGCHC